MEEWNEIICSVYDYFGIFFLGEAISIIFHLPIPGSIIGLILYS